MSDLIVENEKLKLRLKKILQELEEREKEVVRKEEELAQK